MQPKFHTLLPHKQNHQMHESPLGKSTYRSHIAQHQPKGRHTYIHTQFHPPKTPKYIHHAHQPSNVNPYYNSPLACLIIIIMYTTSRKVCASKVHRQTLNTEEHTGTGSLSIDSLKMGKRARIFYSKQKWSAGNKLKGNGICTHFAVTL